MDKRELKYHAQIGGWSAIVTFLADSKTSRMIEQDVVYGTREGYGLDLEIDRLPFETRVIKDKKGRAK